MSHVHAYVPPFSIIFILIVFGVFLLVSLSLSFFRLVALWHLNGNLLRPGTLFVPGHLLLLPPLIPLHLTLSSVMIKSVRTFRRTSNDEAFIRNAKSFYRIFSILTFPLSSTVGVGSHCVLSCHLSLRNYTGILLQYAEIQLFSTSFYYLRLRYDHRSHFGYCIRGATCS